jgi:hypothetical protein
MPTIEYEIKLNDEGRPCIDLPKDYEHRPEDKFFWIEMARYFLQVTRGHMIAPPYDQNTMNMMDVTIPLLGQIGDEMARIVYHNMIAAGEANKLIGMDWDMSVQTIAERDAIPDVGIVYNNRLYLRKEGLKVFVLEGGAIYELNGGTTNENWTEI